MDQIVEFVKEYWLGVLVAFIVVVIIMAIARAVFKIVALAVFVGLVLIFGFNYSTDEVIDLGKQGVGAIGHFYSTELKDVLNAELKDAKITHSPDGKSYTMQTKSIQITGVKGTSQATLTFKGKSYLLPVKSLGENVQKLINEANTEK